MIGVTQLPGQPTKPARPFEASPFREEGPLAVWITEPFGVVTWIATERILTVDDSDWFERSCNEGMRLADPSRSQKFAFVHVWPLLLGYDSGARKSLLRWGFAVAKQVKSIDFITRADAPALVRMAVSVVTVGLLPVGLTVRTHYGEPAVEVLKRLRLSPRSL